MDKKVYFSGSIRGGRVDWTGGAPGPNGLLRMPRAALFSEPAVGIARRIPRP